MSLLSSLGRILIGDVPPLEDAVEARTYGAYPSWEQQLAAFHRLPQSWAIASPDEALTVPAIFRAVTLISNTIGMLDMETFRNGQLITDRAEVPRLTVRPNPRTVPRVFWRDTAYYLASRGEAWWWIANRDSDGNPTALFPVPPWEITVEANPRNRLEPTIRWGDREMDNDDMRQITYLPDRNGLRGVGPLQTCGAAVSVAVEAQEWAANFFSGSIPSIIGTAEHDLSEEEAARLDEQWAEKPTNLPRWMPNAIKVEDFRVDATKAQMVETRRFNDGQAAVMFGIPGSLLEYSMPGSSLTYQNVEGEYRKFVVTCLQPYYLEPIEQEMTDLLTRSTVARFNTNEIQRADLKTKSEVFKNLVESGIPTETAAKVVGFETLDPTALNVAPVPPALPTSEIDRVAPDIRTAYEPAEVRCDGMTNKKRNGISRLERCNRLLSTTGSFVGECTRCKKAHDIAAPVMPRPVRLPRIMPAPTVTTRSSAPSAPPQPTPAEVFMALATREQPTPQVTIHNAMPDWAPIVTAFAELMEGRMQPAVVNVAVPERSVEPAQVNIEPAQVHATVEPAQVTVEPAQVTVEPAQVNVNMPEVRIEMPEPRLTRKRLKRDADGNIVEILEETA